MKPMKVSAAIAVVVLFAGSGAGCGSNGSADDNSKTTESSGVNPADGDKEADSKADSKACADFDAAPDDASKEAMSKIAATAKSDALVDALTELNDYPEDIGFEGLGKIAITYEKIRAACSDAGVKLPSFDELMSEGMGEDDQGEDLPDCPEVAGTEFTYDEVVTMNEDGCMQSDDTRALTVYGGACSDGRQFAYKNLSDLKEDSDGEDDYTYIVVARGKTGKVVASPNGTSDELSALQMDCG